MARTTDGILKPRVSVRRQQQFHDEKRAALERILGPMHNVMLRAPESLGAGGDPDFYLFPQPVGTAIATMQLIQPDGPLCLPGPVGPYELIAFTRRSVVDADDDTLTAIAAQFDNLLSPLARHARDTIYSPGVCYEVRPRRRERHCVILDEYIPPAGDFVLGEARQALLLVIELFPREMEHAVAGHGRELLFRLRAAGHYPYSDLDRAPVV